MKKFKITVEKVLGYCSCQYREGDVFHVEGMNTPEKNCGGAFHYIPYSSFSICWRVI